MIYFEEAGSSSDQRYDYDGTEQSITPLVENYMSSKRSKINSHSYRRSVTSVTNCTRYNEKYLYRLLERSGMLNQRFMANNPEEAGRNFALSYKNLFKAKSDYFDLPQDDSFQSDNINTSFVCNDLCQNIIRGLNEALRKEKNGTLLLRVPFLDDARLRTINDSSTNSTLTSCQLGMFIPVGKCIPQGTEEFEEHSKLCTSCGGVYVLDKMCFPRFINAIKCESQIQKSGCIFDKISTQPHGSCYMRTLTLEVLRNEGNEECQKWHYEYIQIPISCECQLNTESLLLSAVKP
ncbi:unnamed protein product [Acanthocheilonema viteae]|uniref:Spaetzle domain-containing protein n=1 Tax=Acanthocheilonema viteae TaxID=6277 RepID=A0A498SKL8_ACAVI|nr:unnamed protein product [Acanthocheilonema viteae]